MHKGKEAVKKILILSKLQGRIIAVSRKVHLSNLAMDAEDIAQEARLKVLETVYHYPFKPIKEVVSLSVAALYNMVTDKIRQSITIKSYGEVVELTEAISMHDEKWIAETYCTIALNALRESLDDSERHVLDAVLCTDEDVVQFVNVYCEHYNRSVQATTESLSAYFGVSRFMIYRILESIRQKIPAAMHSIPAV